MPPSAIARGGPRWSVGSSLSGSSGGKTVTMRRRRRVLRDSILGITKPALRRLARRGGVKRVSKDIYSHVREAMKQRLSEILRRCVIHLDYRKTKTVTAEIITIVLKSMGITLYGFEYSNLEVAKIGKKPLRV